MFENYSLVFYNDGLWWRGPQADVTKDANIVCFKTSRFKTIGQVKIERIGLLNERNKLIATKNILNAVPSDTHQLSFELKL